MLQAPHLVFIFFIAQSSTCTLRVVCHFSSRDGIRHLSWLRYHACNTFSRCKVLEPGRTRSSIVDLFRAITSGVPSRLTKTGIGTAEFQQEEGIFAVPTCQCAERALLPATRTRSAWTSSRSFTSCRNTESNPPCRIRRDWERRRLDLIKALLKALENEGRFA